MGRQEIGRGFEGIELTATQKKPAFVKPFTPVAGPTVWYGHELQPKVTRPHSFPSRENTFASASDATDKMICHSRLLRVLADQGLRKLLTTPFSSLGAENCLNLPENIVSACSGPGVSPDTAGPGRAELISKQGDRVWYPIGSGQQRTLPSPCAGAKAGSSPSGPSLWTWHSRPEECSPWT